MHSAPGWRSKKSEKIWACKQHKLPWELFRWQMPTWNAHCGLYLSNVAGIRVFSHYFHLVALADCTQPTSHVVWASPGCSSRQLLRPSPLLGCWWRMSSKIIPKQLCCLEILPFRNYLSCWRNMPGVVSLMCWLKASQKRTSSWNPAWICATRVSLMN